MFRLHGHPPSLMAWLRFVEWDFFLLNFLSFANFVFLVVQVPKRMSYPASDDDCGDGKTFPSFEFCTFVLPI